MAFLPFTPYMYCFSRNRSCQVSKCHCMIQKFLNVAVPLGNLFGRAFPIIRTEQFFKEAPNKFSLGISRGAMDSMTKSKAINVTVQVPKP